MNIVLVSSCLFILFLSCVSCNVYYNLVNTQWETFKHQYSKQYATEIEEKFRFKIFLDNYRKVIEHNDKYANNETTFKLSINAFSDMFSHEIWDIRNGYKNKNDNFNTITSGKNDLNLLSTIYEAIPESINWVTKGAVTGVKDQKNCVAPYAFSATGSIEGQLFRTTNKLISLSEQNLIDCNEKNNGCSGGYVQHAFDYITKNKGIDSEESYTFEGVQHKNCQYNQTTRAAIISGYVRVSQNNEKILMETVAKIGPISVDIHVSLDSFYFYSSGVYYDKECSTDPEKAQYSALVVGYGNDQKTGMDYWLVKNSWGPNWGENGYIRIARNENNCCVTCFPIYPIITRL